MEATHIKYTCDCGNISIIKPVGFSNEMPACCDKCKMIKGKPINKNDLEDKAYIAIKECRHE